MQIDVSTALRALIEPVVMLIDVATAAALIRRRLWREFPFLTAFVFFGPVEHLLLRLMDPRFPWASFYVSWAWQALYSLLFFLLLIDLCRSFPGTKGLTFSIPLTLGCASTLIAGASAWLSIAAGMRLRSGPEEVLMNAIGKFCRASSIASLAFLICFLLSIRALRLGWSRRGALLAHGFFWMCLAGFAADAAYTLFPHAVSVIRWFSGGTAIFATSLWAVAAYSTEEAYQKPPGAVLLSLALCEMPVEKVG